MTAVVKGGGAKFILRPTQELRDCAQSVGIFGRPDGEELLRRIMQAAFDKRYKCIAPYFTGEVFIGDALVRKGHLERVLKGFSPEGVFSSWFSSKHVKVIEDNPNIKPSYLEGLSSVRVEAIGLGFSRDWFGRWPRKNVKRLVELGNFIEKQKSQKLNQEDLTLCIRIMDAYSKLMNPSAPPILEEDIPLLCIYFGVSQDFLKQNLSLSKEEQTLVEQALCIGNEHVESFYLDRYVYFLELVNGHKKKLELGAGEQLADENLQRIIEQIKDVEKSLQSSEGGIFDQKYLPCFGFPQTWTEGLSEEQSHKIFRLVRALRARQEVKKALPLLLLRVLLDVAINPAKAGLVVDGNNQATFQRSLKFLESFQRFLEGDFSFCEEDVGIVCPYFGEDQESFKELKREELALFFQRLPEKVSQSSDLLVFDTKNLLSQLCLLFSFSDDAIPTLERLRYLDQIGVSNPSKDVLLQELFSPECSPSEVKEFLQAYCCSLGLEMSLFEALDENQAVCAMALVKASSSKRKGVYQAVLRMINIFNRDQIESLLFDLQESPSEEEILEILRRYIPPYLNDRSALSHIHSLESFCRVFDRAAGVTYLERTFGKNPNTGFSLSGFKWKEVLDSLQEARSMCAQRFIQNFKIPRSSPDHQCIKRIVNTFSGSVLGVLETSCQEESLLEALKKRALLAYPESEKKISQLTSLEDLRSYLCTWIK